MFPTNQDMTPVSGSGHIEEETLQLLSADSCGYSIYKMNFFLHSMR